MKKFSSRSAAQEIVEQFLTEHPFRSSQTIATDVMQYIGQERIREAFTLTYNLFRYLTFEAPPYIQDRFSEIWKGECSWIDNALQYGYESDRTGLLIEFTAQHPDFDIPSLVNMTKLALSQNELTKRTVGGSLALYYKHVHEEDSALKNGYQLSHALTALDYYEEGTPELSFKDRVKALWTLGETGKFSEALETLIPLVNFLFQQENNGIFPLGIGVSGQNMSAIRYGRNGSGAEEFKYLNKSLQDAINISVSLAEAQNRFGSPDASRTARNMLAMMCINRGISFHLPADLVWMMKGVEDVNHSRPVTHRHPNHPNHPWDYDPNRRMILEIK
ncbi:MAG TPA: hypothetical protein PLE43_09055 [Alphaproteobacteria bacterium]|nr:hypothetical protein [Alphaproteobacteria bacterium]